MDSYLWIVWLVVALGFLVIEGITVELVSFWFTISALVTMVLDLCGVPWPWQLGVFVIISALLIFLLRPIAKRYFQQNESKTNIDSIIGDVATVTKDIYPDDRGEVKHKSQYWLAISSDNKTIAKDTKVVVVAVEGAKLIVKKFNEN